MARYIDLDKAIERLNDSPAFGNMGTDGYFLLDVVKDLLNRLPTLNVAIVKHGRWIKRGNEKKCSVCGFIYYSNNDEWNGCPNCLAKMDSSDIRAGK